LEYAGARYHVINRGNYRRDVFQDEGASEAFERTLGEAATRFGWRVAAYVVMRNHFHLALETPQPNLSIGMKWLQGTWARRFNRFRDQVGRPFQGRFKSLVIEDGEGFRRVCDYIHLNPVRARVVPVDEVGTYRRSSLWHYLNGKGEDWMDGVWLLNAMGGLKDNPAGWRHYCDRLGVMMGDKDARESLSAKHLSRGWCVGGDEFKKAMREGMSEQLTQWRERRFAGLEPEAVKEERARSWEEALAACAHAAGIDLAKLTPKKSDEGKVLLAMAMKSVTSVSNGWLAERLGMGQPASVSQFVRRGMADTKKKRRLDRFLSKVKV
jgi:putative transposase